ncbi:MAG: hypothetical protein K2N93_03295 [Alistipes sp.]|nr:hypothetical protein [Alistipes sp.]
MKLLFLLLLAAPAAAALRSLWLVGRGRAARALFASQRGLRGDAPGDLGLSILCCGVGSVAEVERLLAVDYPCCEAVVAIDSVRRPELFAELMARYRMFRIGFSSASDLPAPGIRALARSRQRCFRRLVLVDCAEDPARAAFDAAACVASYDYLLPLRAGETLRSDAVERLAAAVSERPAGEVEAVRTGPDGRVVLVSREALAGAGGCARRAWRRAARRRRLTLWEPLVAAPVRDGIFPPAVRRPAAAVLALAAGFAAGMGWWPFVALLLTAALVWSAVAAANALAAAPLFGAEAPGSGDARC